MNKEEDYASDSDESDEDFCLENENDADSGEEEEEDDESESENEEDDEVRKKPRKTQKGKQKDKAKEKPIDTATAIASVRSTRQTEAKQNGRKIAEKDELESDEEDDKSRSDALWADFLGDVGGSPKPAPTPKEKEKPKPADNAKRSAPPAKPATEILDFAGEQVIVSKSDTSSSSSSTSSVKENQEQPAPAATKAPTPRGFGAGKRPVSGAGGGGGLGSLLNQLGKKKKMSVLEKSQLDWKSFKRDEGIDEELQTHNKGKDGYLERQDFLQRTDLRQFEIEKSLRQTRRQN